MNAILNSLRIKIFADSGDLTALFKCAENPFVKGFTTNPSLMRKAGVSDYEGFAKKLLDHVSPRPVSFEVLSDSTDEIVRQAETIASWNACSYIKIPITDTHGKLMDKPISVLSERGIKVNVTAIMTAEQIQVAARALSRHTPGIISFFAGRVADTGVDPAPIAERAMWWSENRPKVEFLWASAREVLNVFQADHAGFHIITLTPDLIAKLSLVGRALEDYSLETVRTFCADAAAAGYKI